jgi:hypothetical protein
VHNTHYVHYWLRCISVGLLPHSLCRRVKVNATANGTSSETVTDNVHNSVVRVHNRKTIYNFNDLLKYQLLSVVRQI